MTPFETLFKKFPHINQEDFYAAIPPWEIPVDEAVSLYTQYIRKLETEDPDADISMNKLKAGFKFVFNFCKENGLTFEEYQTHTETALPVWVSHLKYHNITFYTLHALTFSNPMVDLKLLEFVIPDFFLTFQKTKNKFYHSKIMKEFAKLAKEKLNEKLK